MPSLQERFYPEATFGGFTRADGAVAFYSRVAALLTPASIVVDFGCGRGAHADDALVFRRQLTCLKGRARKVIGLDVDPIAAANPVIDEFVPVVPGAPWPLPDGSANLVVSDCVLEHLATPAEFFAEASRILAPGGIVCVRTPNRLSYVGLASSLIPNRRHAGVLKVAQAGRGEADVFATYYRCNTMFALRRRLAQHGFVAVVYGHESEPRYMNFSWLAYAAGVLHQKLAPGLIRPELFAFGRKLQPRGKRHAREGVRS